MLQTQDTPATANASADSVEYTTFIALLYASALAAASSVRDLTLGAFAHLRTSPETSKGWKSFKVRVHASLEKLARDAKLQAELMGMTPPLGILDRITSGSFDSFFSALKAVNFSNKAEVQAIALEYKGQSETATSPAIAPVYKTSLAAAYALTRNVAERAPKTAAEPSGVDAYAILTALAPVDAVAAIIAAISTLGDRGMFTDAMAKQVGHVLKTARDTTVKIERASTVPATNGK